MYFGICILFAFVLTWGVSLQTLVYKIAKEEKSLGADDIVLSSPVVDWNKYNRELHIDETRITLNNSVYVSKSSGMLNYHSCLSTLILILHFISI